MKLALLGAPGTGRTSLAKALAALPSETLPTGLLRVVIQPACQVSDTTPDVLTIDDQTPLLEAVTRDVLHGDASQYPSALQHHHQFGLHLLMGMDLPFAAPNAEAGRLRNRIDAQLRAVLEQNAMPFALVYGTGETRLQNALHAINGALASPTAPTPDSNWCWNCENCSDAACEHRLFRRLIQGSD